MKAKVLFQGLARVCLMIVLAGNFLTIPNQVVLAKPLAGTYNCAAQTQIPAIECEALVALYNSANGAGWTNNTGWLQTDTPCSWFGVACDNGANVTALRLYTNALSGSISSELGNLTNLTQLYLYNNALSGSIPPELGSLTNLWTLNLDHNILSGSIPPELGNLPNLWFMILDHNILSGPIPPELGSLPNLSALSLTSNALTGSIPPELGSLTNLVTLWLGNNALTGSIPPELGNAPIWNLDLSNNALSGEIPASFVNLTSLTNLALSCGLTSSNPVVISFIDGILGAGWDVGCSETATPTATGTATPTSNTTLLPTATGTATPTSNGTLLPTATGTATPTSNATLLPTATKSATPTSNATLLPTATGTATPTVTKTFTLTATLTSTLTATPILTPTSTGHTLTPIRTRTPTTTATRTPTRTPTSVARTYTSIAVQDGWILEYSETSNTGGSLNAAAVTFQLGDDAVNRQYRALLSFDTSGLPDNAVIRSAQLKIMQSGAPVGRNPFNALGLLWADIRQGPFGNNSPTLQLADFNAVASAVKVGAFNRTPVGGWYTDTLNAAGLGKVNKTGLTQLRLYFAVDDNNNHLADYIKFFSGNNSLNKPQLLMSYTVP